MSLTKWVVVALGVASCGKPCGALRPGQDSAGLPLETRTTGSAFSPTPPTYDSQNYEIGPATEFWCCTVTDAGTASSRCKQLVESSCSDPKYQGVEIYSLGEPYSHVNGMDDRDICGVVVKEGKLVAAFNQHDG